MLGLIRRLSRVGLLGINQRNADYILPRNDRAKYPMVDDKLLTKQLAERHGLSVPPLYGMVEIYRQVRDVHKLLEQHEDFVVKPAHGSQGHGIVVVTGRVGTGYRRANGSLLTPEDMGHHISNILSGIYSLGGQPDQALIEYRVQFDPVFEKITYLGVPDVRIIVLLGVPVMAMVRLPTRMSDGKANLHQGALGAGIDMATGRTLTAVWRDRIVEEHPDTGNRVSGVEIPHWGTMLDIAARTYDMTGLGYQGVDLVLDSARGPLILEINARPGLNIQIANRVGLRPRLELAERHLAQLTTVADRVAFARLHFGVGTPAPRTSTKI